MDRSDPAWTDDLLADPHAHADKPQRVRRMFAAIAPSYDLNNRLHSFWQDQRWRRKAVKLAELKPDDVVLDVACGTGDLTLAFYEGLLWQRVRRARDMDPPLPGQVIGLDFTFEMLPLADRKAGVQRSYGDTGSYTSCKQERGQRVRFINGDAMALPLPDASADVVSIAFGIRNVADPAVAIREFARILRPGGRLVILEFSQPDNRVIRFFNDLYCTRIMPRTATWISRDRTGAYKYLPSSVKTFIGRQEMRLLLESAGFGAVTVHPMTFGVCAAYVGTKAAR